MKTGLQRVASLFLLVAAATTTQTADIQQSPADGCLALGQLQKDPWRIESATLQNARFVPSTHGRIFPTSRGEEASWASINRFTPVPSRNG
jgi:hypothetical protein